MPATATITINNGATATFNGTSDGGSAAVTANLGGVIDFSGTTGTLNNNKVNVGSIAGAGNYVLGINELTAGSNNQSTTVSGVISGAGSLVKTGTGTLTLSGAATYTGATTVSAGDLTVTGTIKSTLATVNNGGTLEFQGNGFQMTSGGPTTITNNTGGNLLFGNTSSAGTATTTITNASGATTTFNNTSVAGSAQMTNAGAVVFNGNDGTAANSSSASTATITNNGTATLTFNNGSSAGGATINNSAAGTTTTFNNTSTAGTATLTNSGAVVFNGNDNTAANSSSAGSATITNNAAGSLAFNNGSSAGTSTITNSGSLNFNGFSTAGGATITTSNTAFFNGNSSGGSAALTANLGGAFDFSNTIGAAGDGKMSAGSIAGAGNYLLGGHELTVGGTNATTTVSGVIADGGIAGGTGGSLVKIGTGTLTLSGADTYTGATTVNSGDLTVTGTIKSTIATINNGGTLEFSGTGFQMNGASASITANTGGALVYKNASSAGTATITINNGATATFLGTSDGGSAAVTANLGGVVDFSGTTGTLNNNKVSVGSIAGAGNYVLGVNELTTGGNNFSTTVSGVISGVNGALVKTGTGTLTLSGAETYTGATTVNAGDLTVTGTIKSALATVNNGGTLEFQGTGFQMTSGGPTTITTNGGGLTSFVGSATAGNARLIANASGVAGVFDFSGATGPVTAGSIEGAGTFKLGGNQLSIGGNNLSTIVSGIIDDGGLAGGTGGALVKTGTGTTVLSGANTYTGDTTVNNGVLNVSGSIKSAAATVNNGGTLAFSGTGFEMTGASATITTNGGGLTSFAGNATAGTAQLIANTSGVAGIFDFSGALGPVTAGSIEGAGTFKLGGNQLSVGGNNLSTTVSGVIDDGGISGGIGGALVKIGTGTLTLSGTNTYTGSTTVNGGSLIVDGSATSSSFSVNVGGLLGGAGTVGPTAVNGGTLAPNSATLSVHGSLVLSSAATYLVQISATLTGIVTVTGTATVDGTAHIVFVGTVAVGHYTILHSDTGVTGTFATVQANGAALSYDANNVFLDVAAPIVGGGGGAGGTIDLTGLNINQRNAANAINAFGGSLPDAFFGLTPKDLSQASGEPGASVIQSSILASNLFLDAMLDPFVANRELVAAPASYASGTARNAFAAMNTRRPVPFDVDPPANRWNVWNTSYGGTETTAGNATIGSHDTTSRTFGSVVGVDYRVSSDLLAGFALAGGGANFSVAEGLGHGSSDLFQAGVFGSKKFGAAYLAGALAYGWQDVTINRTVAIAGLEQLQSRFHANTFAGRLESGYRIATPVIGITPYAAVQATSFNLPNYGEQALSGDNFFALSYQAKSTTAIRSELGSRFDRSFALDTALLTLRGRAAWAHDYDRDRAVSATFQALPGASFVVNAAKASSDSALLSASAELAWMTGFSISGTFEGEFSDSTRSYAGKGVVKYAW